MDYRKRKYYLVAFCYFNQSIYEIKNKVPSVKIHPPYNHFRNKKAKNFIKKFNLTNRDLYDGDIHGKYVQTMLSCKKEESDILEKLIEEDLKDEFIGRYTHISNVTKSDLGQ